MRRIVLTYLFSSIISILGAVAQTPFNRMDPTTGRDQFGNRVDPNTLPDNLEDSTNMEIQSLPPKLHIWHLSETLSERTVTPTDTVSLDFQNTSLVGDMYGHYNCLDNLDSPRMSRIFSERKGVEPTIFIQPFSSLFVRPDEVKFTNSNIPLTNLTYYKVGNKVNGEERFESYFSVNANKRLAFGFNIDYLYGRGYYQNQSTSRFNTGVFASYIGGKYQMQAVYNNFTMKMNENEDIRGGRYTTRPEDVSEGRKGYESTTIPVKLEQTTDCNKDFYVHATQRYRFGLTQKAAIVEDVRSFGITATNDSMPLLEDTIITGESIPVTSLVHTTKVERARYQFTSAQRKEEQYPNAYLNEIVGRDSTTAFGVKNVFRIALLEGFDKYARVELTAYISHKFNRHKLMDTLSRTRFDEQKLFVGSELAKRQGKTLHYNINGEIGIMDEALGQLRVNADPDLSFCLWRGTVNLHTRGYVSNILPSFYMRHYHSNRCYWDNNNINRGFRARVKGELNTQRQRTNLCVGVENIKNYIYFNQNVTPVQESGNIQVLSATLKQGFHLGILHLDDEVTRQKLSNETVLLLPQLLLYHDLYLLVRMARKVLAVQTGTDIRYLTRYNAPTYTPAIQQFHPQAAGDQTEIGGYPVVNVYANLHLKQTRILTMMYHVNAGMGQSNYFLVPYYPANPRLFKIGISWNFRD